MEVIKCSKGHFYDKALGECPVCAKERSGKANQPFFEGGVEDIGHTAPADDLGGMGGMGGMGSMGGMAGNGFESSPGPTEAASQMGFTPTDFASGMPNPGGNGWQVEDYGPTQPDAVDNVAGFDPIVGWLICVKGPNRGKDYRLHSGTNFIGRSNEMDVCIENDAAISKKNAASLSYDDTTRTFFITKGEVRNLIYLNGKVVRSDADLEIYDRIKIGSTELIFVPLCGEKFNWRDV